MESTKNRSGMKAVVAALCLVALCVAGVFAYLTATDQAVNKLSVGTQLDIEVLEPNWHEENAQNMLPTQEVTKDPQIHNKTGVDAWIFADVVIPQKEIVVADEAGHKQPQAKVDLFTFDANEGWILKDTIHNDNNTVTYRYVYNQQLVGNATTPSIFDKVKVCNFVDEQIDTASAAQQIVINGVGVQASAFDNVDAAYADYFGTSVPETPRTKAVLPTPVFNEVTEEFSNSVFQQYATVAKTMSLYNSDQEIPNSYGIVPNTVTTQDGSNILVYADADNNYIFAPSGNHAEFALPEDCFGMFMHCPQIYGLENLDTSHVTNMYAMFSGCTAETLNITGWNTSNVTNMSGMFSSAKIKSLDLSGWNVSKVTVNDYFNYDCPGVIAPNWVTN